MNLARQLTLRPELPAILNNADYRRRETELKRADEILRLSGIEAEFAEAWVVKWVGKGDVSTINANQLDKQYNRAERALRCMILMSYLGSSYREMSIRLAECPLYQWFCRLDRIDSIRVPSKSELARFVQMVDVETLEKINHHLLSKATEPAKHHAKHTLELRNEVELGRIWMDSTAVKVNIHFPVDWVLLRDATRTLMKATHLIRAHGLKNRMDDPSRFLSRMNGLCMEMSALRRKPDSKRLRKRTLRKMKELVKTVRNHAVLHRKLLENRWRETDWSQAQAEQVIARIDCILEQLPRAVEQAHSRIIRGEKIKNSEKILSLYESEVQVIVRGKAGAEVEFGNSLLLVEQQDGLIVDWRLHGSKAPNDSAQLSESLSRIEDAYGKGTVKAIGADRQFDSPEARGLLEELGIENGVCPRSVKALASKSNDSRFKELSHRRAQTEARVSIIKNVYLDNPLKRRGLHNRRLQVGWSVLSHNVLLLARMPRTDQAQNAQPIAA